MLKPNTLLKKGENYYEFVVAVARKARKIADQADADKVPWRASPLPWPWKCMPTVPKSL